jgi:hypothetical protein
LIPWGFLDKLVENDGHQIKEEHYFPSTNQRIDKGGKTDSGTFSSRLLQQAFQVME